jgi:hypothetical protein
MPHMANAADRDAPPVWYLRAGRVIGAGLVGGAVGGAVAGIWQAGLDSARNACRDGGGLCLGLPQGAAAIAGSVLVIAAGVFVGFGVLRIRPRRLTIPLGCILVTMLTWALGAGMPGGNAPAPWAAGLAAGAGLAALALSVDWGRPQVAGMIAVVVIVIAAFVVPRVISSRMQADAWERGRSGQPRLVSPVTTGALCTSDHRRCPGAIRFRTASRDTDGAACSSQSSGVRP